MSRKMVVLMGPSGCGKTTLEAYSKDIGFPVIISHTTRSPRKGEKNGLSYYFVSKEEFNQIDLAENNQYGENFYGISKSEVERNFAMNDTIVAVAELHGVKQLKEAYPDEVVVVYVTLTLEEMEKRMRARGDSEQDIQFRLQRAINEKEHEHGWIADHTIENWDLTESKTQFSKILGFVDEKAV